ncbi:MAG: mechanosensitive ion channel [Cyclobacteriaceae bacterium]|nr:mechanosensitive ion channel [Cyclobacteriaceae bacterium]
MDVLRELLELELIRIGTYSIRVYTLALFVLIYLGTKFILWLIKKALFRKHKFNKLDTGSTYALFQIIKYAVWVMAIGLLLETIGINVTVLIAGSAALLVGVGLGLQQTFNDVISGIILLSERSIKIDDILEIDGEIVRIQDIGLRTSRAINRDEISFIIPNSLITNNKVINWSHQSKQTRFKINVGVAYGSDVDQVKAVLKESAQDHPEIKDKSSIEVRFMDFGNSSLDFQLLFYSENIFRIEKVKSDIRTLINQKFIESGITIPFPQMDLHIRTGTDKKTHS